MLVWSLVVMGVATALIGLLPTYAAIGLWAPVLLTVIRFVQGIGVGGEWAGAVLMGVSVLLTLALHRPPETAESPGDQPEGAAQ